MENCITDLISLIFKLSILKKSSFSKEEQDILNDYLDNLKNLDRIVKSGFKLTPAIREALQIGYFSCLCLIDDNDIKKDFSALIEANNRLNIELIIHGFNREPEKTRK